MKNTPLSEVESGFHQEDAFDTESYRKNGRHSSVGDTTGSTGGKEARSGGAKMVYSLLLLVSIVCGSATYFLLAESDDRTFRTAFIGYARETADTAGQKAETIFGQLRSLATSLTSNALDESNGFPHVMVSHFDLRTEEISGITGVEMFLFVPMVEQSDRNEWLSHVQEKKDWIVQDYEYRGWDGSSTGSIPQDIHQCTFCGNDTRPGFANANGFMEHILDELGYDSQNLSAPIAQYGPAPSDSSLAMFDLMSHPIFKKEIIASLEYDVPVVSEVTDLSFFLDYTRSSRLYPKHALRSFTLDQVKDTFSPDSKTVGYIMGIVPWEAVFANVLPAEVSGISVIVESDCGSVFTYTANGGTTASIAQLGDHHQSTPQYEEMAVRSKIFWKDHPQGQSRHCHFDLVIYPSDTLWKAYKSNHPTIYAALVCLVFLFAAMLFYFYDKYVQKKQAMVVKQAKRAEAIVTSVFPKEVGLRLIEQAARDETNKVSSKVMINDFLFEKKRTYDTNSRSTPIADLFPETTVMFADIVGFTAWSSMREPSQVFVLLESIYKAFDSLAHQRNVFKVETVGDCYVAVCGLPEPRFDHAVVMSRFAAECVMEMADQVRALEVELGPDTADLGIRVGLHSGPVTAGVLRGDRARFQLFGDTVNTCARIESTGHKNKIHLSKETADFLNNMGKGHWIIARGDKVTAKGKGELETYWLKSMKGGDAVGSSLDDSGGSESTNDDHGEYSGLKKYRRQAAAAKRRNKDSHDRLVDWNVDVLASLLRRVVRQRHQCGIKPDPMEAIELLEKELSVPVSESGRTALDEVVEIIELPRFNADMGDADMMIHLSPEVQDQLHDYVAVICSMYNENSFHSFEHASHVTMSVTKLLGRIVAPDIDGSTDARNLHDHTYGITSDPLTQFAVVLSALLHDVDHSGVSNAQLVEEGVDIAKLYHNKSVAEQNSIDLSWTLLMLDRFAVLRQAIYSTEDQLRRFRQLVVNTVLATDIMDKELQTIRKVRWDKAFSKPSNIRNDDTVVESTNRKATIVIEHLIQASDVAHTMQHWHVYRKWNARLFFEMYKAFKVGRAAKDPSEFWYEGELGFFDFYIIPLAKKLEECGVFGVSSREYLNYAEQNRKEWEAKGRSVVKELAVEAEALLTRTGFSQMSIDSTDTTVSDDEDNS